MLLGYARVSTDQQDHALQLDALKGAGCERVFIETASGTRTEEFQRRGIALRSLTEAIDTSTSGGRFMFSILGALGQMEREIIVERTRAGLAAAALRGRKGGRPLSMTEDKVRAAKAMLASGTMSSGEVARQIGVSASTLYRHLPGSRAVAAV